MEHGDNPLERNVGSEKLSEEQELQDKSDKEHNIDIKFVSDSQNGETKMDCDNIRKAFVGMGKEELMKFANDPFWVRTRWCLFALFWITWVAMLFGAIAIVVYAPKCSLNSSSAQKYSDVIYELNLKAFRSGNKYSRLGYLKGLQNNLDYYKYLGANSILINSLMEGIEIDPDATKDFMKIDSMYGTFEILKHLTDELRDKGIDLIMSFVPNYSSDSHVWFKNSVAKIDPYSSYYIWTQGQQSSDGEHYPPNNWVSVYGNSSWTWVEERKEFYLHQFKPYQPDLNFRNPEVVDYFKTLFVNWLGHGLNGFYLKDAKYLMEDPKFENETANQDGTGTHFDYDFFHHYKTTLLPETAKVIQEWSNVVKEHSGTLFAPDVVMEDSEPSFITTRVRKFGPEIKATDFMRIVQTNLKLANPSWQWECKNKCPNENVAKGILASFILLPGMTIIHGGQELPWLPESSSPWNYDLSDGGIDYILQNQEAWKNDKNSDLNMFKNIIEIKSSPKFQAASTEVLVLNNTVFGFTRVLEGDETYLLLVNFGKETKSVFYEQFANVDSSSEVNVVHCSKNSCPSYPRSEKVVTPVEMIGESFLLFKLPFMSAAEE